MTPTAMNWNYSQKVLLQTILNTWSFFWQPSQKKQMAPTTSIAHDLHCHATCTCTDCSPLNHIAQVLLCSDFLKVKDTQLVWGHKKALTLKCKWLEDDISFWVSAYFQGWTASQMRLSFDMPGHVRIFFKLVTRWVAASFGETTQAEVKTLVKALVKTLVKTVVKWLRLLRPVLGEEFSRKPTYLLPAGTNLSPSSSGVGYGFWGP